MMTLIVYGCKTKLSKEKSERAKNEHNSKRTKHDPLYFSIEIVHFHKFLFRNRRE